MAKILKFNDYNVSEDRASEMIENICNPQINESAIDDSLIKKILKGLSKDLKFNYGLVFTFGTGIRFMYPIIENLIRNGSLKIEMTPENIVLLCVTALSITYLEESQNKAGDAKIACHCGGDDSCPKCNGDGFIDSEVTKKDAQTMLEELKMRGIGNGIVKKFVDGFKSIGKFFSVLLKGTPYVVTGLIDMFGYTALLLPAMNAISAFVGKYDITVDTLSANLISMGIGVGTLVAKQGVTWLIDKLKKSLNIKGMNVKVDTPTAVRPYDIVDTEFDNLADNKLIKEQ
jgi:hypothetical protein